MTNAKLIQAIKAEIERLKNEYTDIAIDSHYGTVNANHIVADLAQLRDFLDTLPEQPVTDCHDLEEEIERQLDVFPYTKVTPELPESLILIQKQLRPFARHFAEWGAEHLKK